LAAFVNRFGTMVLPFLTLYLTTEIGYQEAAAGRLLSIYGIGSIAGAYLAGRCVSWLGAVRLQSICLLISAPLFLIVPWCPGWWSLAATMFLLSLFSNGSRPASLAAITYFAPPELHVRAFGLHRMALNLGLSVGPAMGGVLATIGFIWLFVVDALSTALCAAILIYFFGLRRYSKTRPINEQQAAEAEGTASPLADPMFIAFLGLLLTVSFVFFQIHAMYPLYLRDHYGWTKPMIGMVYAVNTIVIVVFEMLLLDRIRRLPLLRVIAWGGLLSCVGFGILPFGQSTAYSIFCMLIITLGEMLWMPLASAWIAQRSQRGNRGAYMGWYMMTFSIASVVAPAVGGAIYQVDRHLLWYISLVIGALFMAGFTLFQQVQSRELPQSGQLAPQDA
jgi:MFS family permease